MKQQQTKQVNKYDLLNIRIVLNCLLCLFVVRAFHKKVLHVAAFFTT